MAKEKKKKINKKGQTSSQQLAKKVLKKIKKKKKKKKKVQKVNSRDNIVSASDPVPPSDPTLASVHNSSTIISVTASQSQDNGKKNLKRLRGFIFLCSGKTKPECYQYRVFGLPKGKLEVLGNIKPGTKLFLFDFNLKLLYGVYEATSTGNMDLEPSAFGGRFPAQVKFRIFKECLPLPEKSFKRVIEKNYEGNKFKPELSKSQVRDLITLFPPLGAPSSSAPVPTLLPNGAPKPISLDEPYEARKELVRAQRMERLPLQKVHHLQHQGHEKTFYVSHALPGMEHRNRPALTIPYHIPHSQQSYLGGGAVQDMTAMKHQNLSSTSDPYNVADSRRLYLTEGLSHGIMAMEYRSLPAPSDPYHVQNSQQPNFTHGLAQGTTATEHRSVLALRDLYNVKDSHRAYFTDGLSHGTSHNRLTPPSDPYHVGDYEQAYLARRFAHGTTDLSLTALSNSYYVADPQHPIYTRGLSRVMQEPHSRYRTVQDKNLHNQVTFSAPEDRRLHQQDKEIVRSDVSYDSYQYNSYTIPAAPYGTPNMQPQAQAARSLERSAPISYSYTIPAAPHGTPVVPPQALAARSAEANAPVSYSYTMPAPPYVTPIVEPQAPVAGRADSNATVSYYYSFPGATQINR